MKKEDLMPDMNQTRATTGEYGFNFQYDLDKIADLLIRIVEIQDQQAIQIARLRDKVFNEPETKSKEKEITEEKRLHTELEKLGFEIIDIIPDTLIPNKLYFAIMFKDVFWLSIKNDRNNLSTKFGIPKETDYHTILEKARLFKELVTK